MEFDWDGVGGLPLRSDVADTAHDVYSEPHILDDAILGDLVPPSISMSSNGTIEVVYAIDGYRQLFLTFECAGVVSYIRVFEDEQTSVEGVIRLEMDSTSPDDFSELQELYEWLVSE